MATVVAEDEFIEVCGEMVATRNALVSADQAGVGNRTRAAFVAWVRSGQRMECGHGQGAAARSVPAACSRRPGRVRVPAAGSSEIRAQFVLRRTPSGWGRVPGAGLPASCSGAARPDPRSARERRRRLDSSRSTNPARRSEKPLAAKVSGLAAKLSGRALDPMTVVVRWSAVPAVVETWNPHEAHPRNRRAGSGQALACPRRGRREPSVRRCQGTLGQVRLAGLLGAKALPAWRSTDAARSAFSGSSGEARTGTTS